MLNNLILILLLLIYNNFLAPCFFYFTNLKMFSIQHLVNEKLHQKFEIN